MARKKASRKPFAAKAARPEAERFTGVLKNVSDAERLLRMDAGIALIVVIAWGLVSYPLDYVAGILSLVLVLTAFTGVSPLYKLLGVRTRK